MQHSRRALDETHRLYRQTLEVADCGHVQALSQLAERFRNQVEINFDPNIELARRILVTRIAFRQSLPIENIETFLYLNRADSNLFLAEAHFVQGLHHFHLSEYSRGANCFSQAAEKFLNEAMYERYILSLYNQFIGDLNSKEMDLGADEDRISFLERLASHYENKETLGLIIRHKAWVLERQGRIMGAQKCLDEALTLLRSYNTISDFQLGSFQLCDILLKLNEREKARQLFESVTGPFDTRVLFPKAYLHAKLNDQPLPEPERFLVVSPVWLEKYKISLLAKPVVANRGSDEWDIERGIYLIAGKKQIQVKPSSLEGRLIFLLLDRRRPREEIISLLWPDQCDSSHVSDRLRKILARIENKLDKIILFDGKCYFLSRSIQVTSSIC